MAKVIKCTDCNGSGKLYSLKLLGGGDGDLQLKKCPTCGGTGKIVLPEKQ